VGLARAAIVDTARDKLNRIFVLDAWAGRPTTDELVGLLIAHAHRWRPGSFGIDATAQQGLFVDTVRSILRLRGETEIHVEGRPAPTRAGDKVYRIRTVLQPIIAEHRLFVNDTLVELLTEMAAFPTGSTIDLVDALAEAIRMYPEKVSAADEREAGVDLYREHLREQGLTEGEIDARIDEESDTNDDEEENLQWPLGKTTRA